MAYNLPSLNPNKKKPLDDPSLLDVLRQPPSLAPTEDDTDTAKASMMQYGRDLTQTPPLDPNQGNSPNQASPVTLPPLNANQPTAQGMSTNQPVAQNALPPLDAQNTDTSIRPPVVNNPSTPVNTTPSIIPPLDPLAAAEKKLADVAAAPVQKQGKLSQAAFLALQTIQHIMNPNDNTPIQWLGSAKKANAINQAQRELAPLSAIEAQKQADLDAESKRKLQDSQITLNQNKPAMAREALRAKVEAATTAQSRRLDVINRQADIKSGEAELYTDEDGYQWKKYLKPDSSGKLKSDEPVVNPTTGQQEQLPGMEQVDWTDPNTGVVTKQRAKDVLMPSATIAAGNAGRQQQTNIHNSGQLFEAQKTNAASMTTYNNNVLSHAEKILAQQGKSTESIAKVQGMNNELQILTQQLNNYDDNNDYDGSKRNALIEKIAAKNTEVQDALGKMDAGSDALEQMSKEKIIKPQMVKAVPIQAVKVGGGMSNGSGNKPAAVSEDVYRRRLVSHGVKDTAQQNQLVEKARNEGVIR